MRPPLEFKSLGDAIGCWAEVEGAAFTPAQYQWYMTNLHTLVVGLLMQTATNFVRATNKPR